MATLNSIDRKQLEDTLGMSGGYVLDFTSRREFAINMQDVDDCNIYADIYGFYGNSMANRLRAFWEIEDAETIAQSIQHLLDYAERFNLAEVDKISQCRSIVYRLTGAEEPVNTSTREAFLSQDFPHIDFQRLPIEGSMIPIMEERWEEAKHCAEAHAHLSVTILLGSLLEAMLLGAAQRNPRAYNTANSTPLKDDKPLPFYRWNLADLIDVSTEVGFINLDVKKHSHALREFRNYVHPYQQVATSFTPDQDTTNISIQVFRAAANQLINACR